MAELKMMMILAEIKHLEMPGLEPGAFRMQSERSTAELHPLTTYNR